MEIISNVSLFEPNRQARATTYNSKGLKMTQKNMKKSGISVCYSDLFQHSLINIFLNST